MKHCQLDLLSSGCSKNSSMKRIDLHHTANLPIKLLEDSIDGFLEDPGL